MPAYSSLIILNSNKRVLVGTEMGVYGTDDISLASPNWALESSGMGTAPIFDLKQQTMTHWPIIVVNDSTMVSNYGMIYAATHGRGIFECSKYVGINDPVNPNSGSHPVINVFPNPVRGLASLSYSLKATSNVVFNVYDISGKVVKTMSTFSQSSGNHTINMDVSEFPAGTYLLRMDAGRNSESCKFVVW